MTIDKQKIFEIWSNVIIEKTFHDKDGSWIGIRKSLIDEALRRKVIALHIKTLDTKLDLTIPPEEFVGPKSKMMMMPSKYYKGTYQLCLYLVSKEIIKTNKKVEK